FDPGGGEAVDSFLKKLKKGDEKAFEQLVRENQNKIYAVCLNMLKNSHDAQDAAQETFIKAYRGLSAFMGESRVDTWLTRIAVNTCLDMIRKRRDTVNIDDSLDAASEETPETESEKNTRVEAVRKAVRELPPDMRAVVVLRDIEGHSYEDVAQMLNINIGTVRSRLFRAREKLKNLLLENRELF
ncbi:MAG: RNA polymerase sigma factor, partial [Clostridia bacterium]